MEKVTLSRYDIIRSYLRKDSLQKLLFVSIRRCDFSMITRFGKYIPLILIATAILVIVDSLVSFKQIQNIEADHQELTRTRNVLEATKDSVIHVLACETAEKIYIITGNENIIPVFNDGKKGSIIDAQKVIALAKKDSNESKQAKNFLQAIQKRISFLGNIINIRRTNGVDEAAQYIYTPESRASSESVLQTAATIQKAEESLLEERTTTFNNEVLLTKITTILSMLLNIFLLFITYFLIRRELQQRTLIDQQKNEFINFISHELRTPITSLSLYIQLLLKPKRQQKEKTIDVLKKMNVQIFNMRNLITDMLDVTRMQLGKLTLNVTNLSFYELAKEVQESLQLTTKKHKIVVKGPRALDVHADRERILQVLINLVNNAIKYSPNGGKITLAFRQARRKALVEVTDQGIGISKENQEKIFDRYFRVERSEAKYGGLGIGLYITARIIYLHKGKIWVKSEIGKGSTFAFTLPLAKKRKIKLY